MLSSKQMLDMINGYRKSNAEFDTEVPHLLQNSNQNELTEEALADVSGQLFGNQEFINNLSLEKLNVFKRIYNKIIEWANKITGNSNEALFIKDLKNKWEEAYRTQNNNLYGTKYHISSNLSSDIDNVLNDVLNKEPIKVRDYTPKILVNNGIKDLPMYENPSHVRKNILTEQEALSLGLTINSRDHYHGLGKENYIKAIDSLDNPRVIFKNNNNNDYMILTIIKDNNSNNIVIPIEIETQTRVNTLKIDTNRIKTVYGYEKKNNIDLNDYIKYNIKNNVFTKIYEQKNDQGTGFSTATRSNTSILPTEKDVNRNTTTKYSIQESENNSGSFSLQTEN